MAVNDMLNKTNFFNFLCLAAPVGQYGQIFNGKIRKSQVKFVTGKKEHKSTGLFKVLNTNNQLHLHSVQKNQTSADYIRSTVVFTIINNICYYITQHYIIYHAHTWTFQHGEMQSVNLCNNKLHDFIRTKLKSVCWSGSTRQLIAQLERITQLIPNIHI